MSNPDKRAICFTLWLRDRNNPRYAVLFPRLAPFVQFRMVTLSRRRVIRALQFRAWMALKKAVIYPAAARCLAARYATVFTVDTQQIPAWPGNHRVVVDMDDPVFTAEEIETLRLPQVKAIVVTTEQAKGIYRQRGVACPIHIIPQGVAIEQLDANAIREIRMQCRSARDVVIGYHAPTLTLSSEGPRRARQGQDDLDFLFAALESARHVEPRIKLWLFGEPSAAVKHYASATRSEWIRLFGYVPLSNVLNYISSIDIGVYPRTWAQPPARFNVKLAQFMACGIPVVARDLDESYILKEARSGIVCQSQEDFSAALVALARSAGRRAELADAGRAYAREYLDWSTLVPRYQEILAG
jgi:glycosyltransferase involved in cell wall biosynthesis